MGVVSNGMLCSGDELRLTGDGDGILILPPDAPLGAPSPTSTATSSSTSTSSRTGATRSRLIGLAREVAAVDGRHGSPARRPTSPRPARRRPSACSRRGRGPGLCARFVGRWVSGVKVGPSPDRVQMRLLAAGMRPISNVVDASNYVMLELGKPIHTFDAAAVAGADGRAARSSGGRRRASASRRSTTSSASSTGHAPHRRPDGPARRSPGSWAAPVGGRRRDDATSSSSPRSSTRSRSAGPASATRSDPRPASASASKLAPSVAERPWVVWNYSDRLTKGYLRLRVFQRTNQIGIIVTRLGPIWS